MMKRLLFFFLVLFAVAAWYRDPSAIVQKMALHGRMESEFTGFAGAPSVQYRRYKRLQKHCSDDKLLELLDHPSPVVVAYAAQVVIDRQLLPTALLFERFIEDERTFSRFSGCIIGSGNIPETIYYHHLGKLYEGIPSELDVEEEWSLRIRKDSTVRRMDEILLAYPAHGLSIQPAMAPVEGPVEDPVDSLVLVVYEGGRLFPPPTPPLPGDSDSEANRQALEAYQRQMTETYLLYHSKRDMPLPPHNPRVLDREGRFHPTVLWRERKVWTGTAQTELLRILDCQIPLPLDNASPSACFDPHHAVLVYAAGKVQRAYSICFNCHTLQKSEGQQEDYVDCINWKQLAAALKNSGLPWFDEKYTYSDHLKKHPIAQ